MVLKELSFLEAVMVEYQGSFTTGTPMKVWHMR